MTDLKERIARFRDDTMNMSLSDALPLLDECRRRIEELERELTLVKSHHTARYVVDTTNKNERLTAENRKLQEAYIKLMLEAALNNTAEVRRRLKESEFIPAELWEMRFK